MAISKALLNGLGRGVRSGAANAVADPMASVNSSVDNATTRLAALGVAAPTPKSNFLVDVLKNLSRTGYAGANVIREFSNPEGGNTPGTFDPLKAFTRGLTLEETPMGKDVFTDIGMKGNEGIFGGGIGGNSFFNPSPAGMAGLALDILNPLDALNWVAPGLGKTTIKGGVKGAELLTKTFGTKAAQIIASLGDDAVKELASPSVGRLMSKVGKVATEAGVKGDALTGVLTAMREGIAETGLKATSKLPYKVSRPITMGLQNPLTLGVGKTFANVEVPGTGAIGGALTMAGEKFMTTKVGDALGRAFSTKHVPTNVPDSVIINNITSQQMDDVIGKARKGTFKSPMDESQLVALKAELDGIKIDNTYNISGTGDFTNFDSIAAKTGVDAGLAQMAFEQKLPFTMHVTELYDMLKQLTKEAGNNLPDTEIFSQAARLRKVMDLLADNIPEQLRPFFKGTIITPKPLFSVSPSKLPQIEHSPVGSPMLNYVFSNRGVDIRAIVNRGRGFNTNLWNRLATTMNGLGELPPQNLATLKEAIQLSPVPLGNLGGAEINAYAQADELIVLYKTEPFVLKHEYGHVIDVAGGLDLDSYRNAIDTDNVMTELAPGAEHPYMTTEAAWTASINPEQGIKEDFADSFAKRTGDPAAFDTQYPARGSRIQEILGRTARPKEAVNTDITAQAARASTMSKLAPVDKQIDTIIADLDKYVEENITKFKFTSGSEAYHEVRQGLTALHEQTSYDKETLNAQVESIFGHLPVEERKKIMDYAARGINVLDPQFSRDYAPVFYSKLRETIETKMGGKSDVESLRKMLKSAGVKDEEMKWSGFDELTQNKTRVTKQEVLDFLTENQIEIKEVEKGAIPEAVKRIPNPNPNATPEQVILREAFETDRETTARQLMDEWNNEAHFGEPYDEGEIEDGVDPVDYAIDTLIDDYGDDDNIDPSSVEAALASLKDGMRAYGVDGPINETQAASLLRFAWDDQLAPAIDGPAQYTKQPPTATKYSGYKLPGGEDYHELLFTLPTKESTKGFDLSRFVDRPWFDYIDEATEGEGISVLQNMISSNGFDQAGQDSIALFLRENGMPEHLISSSISDIKGIPQDATINKVKYQSAHWSEPNVVAHTRFDTRYTPEGEKVLFIEEIQSDWHQAGRKEGYRAEQKIFTPEQQKLIDAYKAISKEMEDLDPLELAHDDWAQKPHIKEIWKRHDDAVFALNEAGVKTEDFDSLAQSGIAHAPFEKTWPELVQKRMVRYAAENGYDRIAWATGKQSADRYSLARAVDQLTYDVSTLELTGRKNGMSVFTKNVSHTELPDYVGQEVAAKLLDAPESGFSRVSGLDLEVGGEGMKGFYDNMIPSSFNKMGKKFGVQVEPISLELGQHVTPGDYEELVSGLSDNWYGEPPSTFGAFNRDIGLSLTNWSEEIEPIKVSQTGLNDLVDKIWNSAIEESKQGANFKFKFTEENKQKLATTVGHYVTLVDEPPVSAQQSMKIPQAMKDEVLYRGQAQFKRGAKPTPQGEQLAPESQAALESFIKWRESVVKMYKDRQIPIEELINYVPYIPVRALKPDESAMMGTLFGTGNYSGNTVDELVSLLSKTDPNLIERTTKGTTPKEVNKLLGKDWLTEDAAVAMSLRGSRAIEAVQVADFLKGITDKYGIDVGAIKDVGQGGIPKGYKMYIVHADQSGKKVLQEVFDAASLAKKGKGGSFFFPEEMAKIYNEYTDVIFGTKAKNPLLKIYDAATSAYKKVAYLWNPGHIPRDFTGNVFNNYLAGVTNPLEYTKTLRRLTHPDEVLKFPSGEMTMKELLDMAHKNGTIDVGAYMAETPRDVIDKLNLPGKNPIIGALGKYSNLMRQGTQKTDMLTRMTLLIHEMDKGKPFLEASATVKKFLFDYFDLTPFERKVMKRIVPFYTWIRKNIPLQVEQMMKNPRAYARVGKVMNALQGSPVDYEERPDYINDSGAMKLGDTGMYASPSLPYADLARVPTNLDAILQLLSGVNPIIRAPLEMATNTQWFSGNPIEQYEGETRDMPFGGIMRALGADSVPQVGKRVAGTMLDQIPILRNLDAITNPDNPRQTSRLSSFLGGPALYSEEGVEKSKAYEDRDRLNALIRKLTDQGEVVPTMKDLKKSGASGSRIRDILR